jgi:hypothetical protein
MTKAFILFYILSGEPVAIKDYDTLAECTTALAIIKSSAEAKEWALHKCLPREDFLFAVDLADQRLFEIWRRDGGVNQ